MQRANLPLRDPRNSAAYAAPPSTLPNRETAGESVSQGGRTNLQTNLPKHQPARQSGPTGQGQLVAMARARTAAQDSNTEVLDEIGKKICAKIEGLGLPGVSEETAKKMAWYAQQSSKNSAPEGTGGINRSERKTLQSLAENLSEEFPFISISVAKKMILYARDELRPSAPAETALEGSGSSTSQPTAVPAQRNPKLDLPPQYGSRAALEDTHLRGAAFEAASANIFHREALSYEHGVGTSAAIESSHNELIRKGKEQAKNDEELNLEGYKDIANLSPEMAQGEIINLKLDMESVEAGKKEFVFKAFANSICSFYKNSQDAKQHKDNCGHVIGTLKQLMDKFPGGIPEDLMAHAVNAMVAQEKYYKSQSFGLKGIFKPKSYRAIPKIDANINIRLALLQKAKPEQKAYIGSIFSE